MTATRESLALFLEDCRDAHARKRKNRSVEVLAWYASAIELVRSGR